MGVATNMRERSFRERMGIVEVSTVLQHDSMSQELRNSLWNVLYRHIWISVGFMCDKDFEDFPGDIMDFSHNL